MRLTLTFFIFLAGLGGLSAQAAAPSESRECGSFTPDRHCFKQAPQSVRWDYEPGSVFSFDADKPLKADAANLATKGISLWICNPAPSADSLVFEVFDEKGDAAFRFPFYLRGEGWRACWTGFANMQACKQNPARIKGFRILPPAGKGTVWIDRITFPVRRVNARTTPDWQVPDNSAMGDKTLWHWCRTLEWSFNECPSEVPSVSALKDLGTLRERFSELTLRQGLQAMKSGSTSSPKPLFPGIDAVTVAKQLFAASGIRPLAEGGYAGAPLVDPDELNPDRGEFTLRELDAMLYGFALDAVVNGNSASRDKYFLVWRYALWQGFAEGSGMGTNHHYGYKVRDLFSSVWLMRDEILKAPEREAILGTIRYWSAVGETFKPYERGRDGIIDAWHTLLIPKIIAALLPDDDTYCYNAMASVSRWVAGSLRPSPGTVGGFKEDGTGFHHGGFYPGYTSGAVAALGEFIEFVTGTQFLPDRQSLQSFAKALRTMRNYCNRTEWGIGICGRHPFNGGMTNGDIQAFASLALAGDLSGRGDSFDRDLAADYLRLCRNDTKEAAFFRKEGIIPAKAPEGFFPLNSGAAGIFRGGEWMVTLKGYTTDVWGSEIYVKDNRYGRYQSYGSAQIFSRDGRRESGFVQEGWDWNRLPGVTSIHLPLEELDSPLKNTTMAKSSVDYAGSSALEGSWGMFSMILTENNLERFTPDFTARKSVFCFGNRMVFLGSGISNSNAARQTETTLFQHSFTGVGTAISVNRKKLAAFFDSELPDKGLRHLEDGFGNHYFIPQGGGAVRTGISHQVSAEEKTRERTEGDFAWAVIPHGTAPKDASYEYWILLAPDSGQVRASVSRRPYEVLQQDTRAHIVRDPESGVVARSFFEDFDGGKDPLVLGCTAQTMVMSRPAAGALSVSVCDPGLHLPEKAYSTATESVPVRKVLRLKGSWRTESGDVKASPAAGGTVLEMECRGGIPLEFTLIPVAK